MHRPIAVLTDIEGTTTPARFVTDTLFPYARARLPDLLADPSSEVSAALHAVRVAHPGRRPLDVLTEWMDRDVKATPLKTLQGIAWRTGYVDGSLRGVLYPDVAPALRRWHGSGMRLGIFSSGSVMAQRLLFAHTADGDLTSLFASFHDTTLGAKRDPASYRAIAGGEAADWLFLSDVAEELEAASDAGLRCIQVVRQEDGTVADAGFCAAGDFDAVERLWESP